MRVSKVKDILSYFPGLLETVPGSSSFFGVYFHNLIIHHSRCLLDSVPDSLNTTLLKANKKLSTESLTTLVLVRGNHCVFGRVSDWKEQDVWEKKFN